MSDRSFIDLFIYLFFSVSAFLFLDDRWQCCSSIENRSATLDSLGIFKKLVLAKHFYKVIVQFKSIRIHFWQIYCYMETQMKETLEVMKVGNMYYEVVRLLDWGKKK